MKKLLVLLMLLAAGMFVVPGSALCYTIDDPTGDYTGESLYEIYGMDVTQNGSDMTLEIYTDCPGSNTLHYGSSKWTTFQGDLAIDLYGDPGDYPQWTQGTYEYGVAFSEHAFHRDVGGSTIIGGLYTVNTGPPSTQAVHQGWYTSDYYWTFDGNMVSGFSYNSEEIVTIAKGSLGGPLPSSTSNVSWNTNGSPSPQYQIVVTLNDFLPADFDGTVAFRWASGTCGNDIVEGEIKSAPVPEPATMLLLGCGLVALAGFGRKRLSRK